MKYFSFCLAMLVTLAMLAVIAACNPNHDMENNRLLPASRPRHHREAKPYGVKSRPVVDLAFLKKGRENYNIHCRLCHGTAGFGDGHIPKHGFPYGPPTFHSESARRLSVEDIFNVATDGKGIMLGFGDRLQESTRLAIANYVKALQLSRRFPLDRLTGEERRQLERPAR